MPKQARSQTASMVIRIDHHQVDQVCLLHRITDDFPILLNDCAFLNVVGDIFVDRAARNPYCFWRHDPQRGTAKVTRFKYLAMCALAICGLLGVARAADPETSVKKIATYSIDSDTFELVRYSFSTNEFIVVGVVKTASDQVVEDCESLALIPRQNSWLMPVSSRL